MSLSFNQANIGAIQYNGQIIGEAMYNGQLVYSSAPALPVENISVGSESLAARNAYRNLCIEYGTTYTTVENLPFNIDLTGTSNAAYMFDGSTKLKQMPVITGLEGVTNFGYFVRDCSALESIDIHLPAATTVSYFADRAGIQTANISAPALTNGDYLLDGADKLVSATVVAPNLTQSRYMFRDCSALSSTPTLTMPNLKHLAYMFQDCTSLPSFTWTIPSSSSDLQRMFSGCTSLVTTAPITTTGTINPNNMFSGCSALSYVGDIDVPGVSGTTGVFSNCAALTDGNVRMLVDSKPGYVSAGMISGSGLTRAPFYDKLGNPL